MKIVEVERFPIRMNPTKFDDRAQDQLSMIASVETVIIRVRTDSSVVGFGEAASIPSDLNQTMGGLLDWLDAYATALIGADALNLNDVNRRLDQVSGTFPPGCQPARAAIDMAAHDIIGKARECPVFTLLGGAYRTEFETLTSLLEDTPEESASAARRFVELGSRGLKVKIGDSIIAGGRNIENLERERQKLLAVLEAVGAEIYVDVDANQSWASPGQVRSTFAAILAEQFYGNLSLEQPLHHLDLDGHAELCETLAIPVILDESVISPEAMMQIVRRTAADRVVLKISRVGGFHNAQRIAHICEAAAIGISVDTVPFTKLGDAAHCHLAATLRDPFPIDAQGHLWFEKTPFVGGFEIENGRAVLGDAPGLGVELDEDVLRTMIIAA
jgi:L-alanine-DL-glutamate epimerase-like enolase superfamily enzyme